MAALRAGLLVIIIIIIIITKRVLLECRWVKSTPRTLHKWNSKIKSGEHRWEKVKMMTWQKDAFSADAWRCWVSQTQWRWMAKCSRCSVQRRRTCNLQSSYDMKMAWQWQMLTQIATSFSRPMFLDLNLVFVKCKIKFELHWKLSTYIRQIQMWVKCRISTTFEFELRHTRMYSPLVFAMASNRGLHWSMKRSVSH